MVWSLVTSTDTLRVIVWAGQWSSDTPHVRCVGWSLVTSTDTPHVIMCSGQWSLVTLLVSLCGLVSGQVTLPVLVWAGQWSLCCHASLFVITWARTVYASSLW